MGRTFFKYDNANLTHHHRLLNLTLDKLTQPVNILMLMSHRRKRKDMPRNIKRISYSQACSTCGINATHDNDNCPRSENCYLLGEYGYARSALCGALWPRQVIYWLVTKIHEVATALPELGEKAT